MHLIMNKVIIVDTSSLEWLVFFNMHNCMTVEDKVKLETTIRIHKEKKQELVVSKVYGCFGSMGCRAFASNCHIFTFKRKWFHIKPMSLLSLYFITFNVYGEKDKLNLIYVVNMNYGFYAILLSHLKRS